MENSMGIFFIKLKIKLQYYPAIQSLGLYLEKTDSKGYIHTSVYYGTVYYGEDMEAS